MTESAAPSSFAPLSLYDTLSATKKPLALQEPGRCKLYVCGPTVYDLSLIHI